MNLSRQEILDSKKLTRKEVAVPEWGGSVFVRVMTGIERETFERHYNRYRLDGKLRAWLTVMSACTEHGVLLFGEDDVHAVSEMPWQSIDRIWDVSTELNKTSPADLETLEKN